MWAIFLFWAKWHGATCIPFNTRRQPFRQNKNAIPNADDSSLEWVYCKIPRWYKYYVPGTVCALSSSSTPLQPSMAEELLMAKTAIYQYYRVDSGVFPNDINYDPLLSCLVHIAEIINFPIKKKPEVHQHPTSRLESERDTAAAECLEEMFAIAIDLPYSRTFRKHCFNEWIMSIRVSISNCSNPSPAPPFLVRTHVWNSFRSSNVFTILSKFGYKYIKTWKRRATYEIRMEKWWKTEAGGLFDEYLKGYFFYTFYYANRLEVMFETLNARPHA